MTHETETQRPSAIPTRKPARWVLRGDPKAVARARRNRLPLYAKEE